MIVSVNKELSDPTLLQPGKFVHIPPDGER